MEALYTNEFGRAAVGMCRRVSYDDGSGQMWGDVNTANFVSLEGGNDSGIELLYFFDKNKKLTGIHILTFSVWRRRRPMPKRFGEMG